MKQKRPYSTARATAAIRALHLLYDHPPVFNDSYALQFTSPAFRRACRSRFFPWLLSRSVISGMLRPISAQILSRAKYSEEKLQLAASKGISQYVIIGAGFDSFCLRRPDFSAGLQIVEIDHPVTQQIKRQRLRQISPALPEGVEFLAVDLEKKKISDALADSSFAGEEKAFFSWLGTVPYLSKDVVYAVLRDIASLAAPGSEIVFDYLMPADRMEEQERRNLFRVMRITELWGEPVNSFFEPQELADALVGLGYHVLENQSPAEQNRRYFLNRSDNLLTHSTACNLHAAVRFQSQ